MDARGQQLKHLTDYAIYKHLKIELLWVKFNQQVLLNRNHVRMLIFRPGGNAGRTAEKAPLRGLLGARELLRNSL
ncbi:MAG: hypothetical protein HQL95_13210 [Magnetococcales bacterium]|nr:hypothetical protein [Magnetococcales bacterium]